MPLSLVLHPSTERMTFVDAHQAAFASHGACARGRRSRFRSRMLFGAPPVEARATENHSALGITRHCCDHAPLSSKWSGEFAPDGCRQSERVSCVTALPNAEEAWY
jgi:hypothetical protein